MKFVKRGLLIAILVSALGAVGYFVVYPSIDAYLAPAEIRLTRAEIEARCSVSPNHFVESEFERDVLTDDSDRTWVDYKLFGLIPIRRVKVDILPYDELVAGGVPVGFNAKTDGVVVLHDACGYKRGDVITSIDSASVTSVKDLERHLGERRLGIWVKDDTSGVGTLTYVNPANNNFAALGHKLVDAETGANVNLRSGEVFPCNLVGIERSTEKTVGSYQSTLRKSAGAQGSVLSSNSRGVFGCLNADSMILDWCKQIYPVASRYSVKKGPATVLCALDGQNVQEFDAEIVKVRFQKHNSAKGIILKITDPRLLSSTGGIIHGMSGSPIIQNGHLVGAVTHVIAGDPKRGYGIYIDFVIP
jgi:stage IV sporulation protein B